MVFIEKLQQNTYYISFLSLMSIDKIYSTNVILHKFELQKIEKNKHNAELQRKPPSTN